MKLRASGSVAAVLMTGVAQASSIGVFFAPDGSDCDGVATPLVPFTIYVGAVLGGDAAAAGIVGAEFSLAGADPAWITTVTPNPAADIAIGNPVLVGNGGCDIAFPGCQPGPYVPLYTIQFTSPVAIAPRTFAIRRHLVVADPIYACVLLRLCGGNFTKLCVAGGQAFLNDPTRACTVGVEQQTWSTVKSMFR